MKKLFLFLISLPSLSFAKELTSLGDLAVDLMEPVGIITDFIGTGCLIIGISCIFGAFLKYMQHRINPMAHTLSSIVGLFLIGLALIGLPFVYKLTQGAGVPFHLF